MWVKCVQAKNSLFRCFFLKKNHFTNTINQMQCKSDCTKSRPVTCQYHNGEVDERLCSADTKPKTVGMCCRFKWRLKWSPVKYIVVYWMGQLIFIYKKQFFKCSTSCGTGIQKRNRFCVRTQLKSIKSRSPRRKGEIVDNIYCQNITVPHLSPQRKYCFRRNCNPPKWVAFPWSRVSVAFSFFFFFFFLGSCRWHHHHLVLLPN